jgi:uroporphyrinogen decarboxylase
MDAYRIRQGVDGVLIEQDMGGSEAPFISPRMFKRLCFPYMKERIQNIKKRVPKVILHNCGNNLPLMDMFLDAGIDAYESIQTNTEMSVETLIGRFGKRLTVWGAVSLDALNLGTTDDVRQDVRRCITAGKKAPGFILGPSHSIAFGTKYDNFRAMLDEFVKHRDMS